MIQEIRTLEDSIIELLNASTLSIEVKRLILSDVLHLTMRQADKEFIQEMANAEST